jgi:hypothetical protein
VLVVCLAGHKRCEKHHLSVNLLIIDWVVILTNLIFLTLSFLRIIPLSLCI